MYGREYAGKTINFEASGGLIHSSLVMQDRETDTYWAIMSGEAVAGELKGTKLQELPVSERMQWKDWVKKYPETLVLSVDGKEDGRNYYQEYFNSSEGFRGTEAKDKRLNTKDPIFAFRYEGKSFAVAYKAIEGGKSFNLGSAKLFLYRPPQSDIFISTIAYITNGSGFKKIDDTWVDVDSNCNFNSKSGSFENSKETCPARFQGIDTFWYNWSLNNPNTKLLAK